MRPKTVIIHIVASRFVTQILRSLHSSYTLHTIKLHCTRHTYSSRTKWYELCELTERTRPLNLVARFVVQAWVGLAPVPARGRGSVGASYILYTVSIGPGRSSSNEAYPVQHPREVEDSPVASG